MLFAITPDIFHRVELWGVCRQILKVDRATQAGDKVPHQTATVSRQPVPNHQQLGTDVPLQMPQEFDDLRAFDAAGKQPEIEAPDGNASYSREAFPVKGILQHGSFAAWGPSSHAVGTFTQAALVDKYYSALLLLGFFFISGQRTRFHRRMAASLRCVARTMGRWQIQPRQLNIRHTCAGWIFSPVCRAIKSATRQVVQRAVPYPSTSGPSLSPQLNCSNCSGDKRGLRPARPAFSRALVPCFCQAWCHRLTDCRCTPSFRETSPWLRPRSKSRAALSRRRSNSSKSRSTPFG